jgi:hypothetical protein
VRLCWAPAGGGFTGNPYAFPPTDMPMPASNYAGIPQGGAAMLAVADSLTMTAGPAFDLYVLDAQMVATKENGKKTLCAALVCDGNSPCLGKQNVNNVFAIPALTPGSPYLLAITGTPPQLAVQTVALGADDTINPGALAVQAAQLTGGLTGTTVTFGGGPTADAGTGGGFVASLAKLGDVDPPMPASVPYDPSESAFATQGFSVDGTYAAPDGGGGAVHLEMSLAQSLSLVAPTQDPHPYFGQRTPFVVAVVGDPGAPPWPGSDAGAYDGTGLHLLVLPTTRVGPPP